ncbi:hypothetical protein BGAL_0871g00010 [Botrytis galanthina]|uniref:Uncharacterized protein n=1 Tax=Botrytis galanthina TaxID=278940 RepID=A0A4S8QQX4_9HELO|nr:hypothetical protein BGAL_0871g00010 [Botrytis galanthina]
MPTIEHCLTNFQPFIDLKVSSSRSHSYGDPIYRELGEKADVGDWDDFTIENLKNLRNLAALLNKEIEMTLPERFSSDLMLYSEANLDSFVANTLLYTVKTVLGHIFEDLPISILSQVPFLARSLKKSDPIPVLQRYTPDYSVFRGDLEGSLADSDKAALVVGDAKLIGTGAINDKELLQKGKSTAQRHHMGQLLWYCCRRKTRFAMHISEHYLVVAQCTYRGSTTDSNVEEIEIAISEALAQADVAVAKALEGMVSSEEIDSSVDPVTPTKMNKRMKPTSDGSNFESSPASLPKRNKASPETTSATTSQLFSSPPRSSPGSKQGDDTHPHEDYDSTQSPVFVSSQFSENGGMNNNKVKALSKDGGFQVHLFTLDLRKSEAKDAPLVVLGIIALAALVDVDDRVHAKLRMSRESIKVTDYF